MDQVFLGVLTLFAIVFLYRKLFVVNDCSCGEGNCCSAKKKK